MSSGGINYRVRHVTEVRYDSPVKLARFNLRLMPAEWPGQTLVDCRLDVSPKPRELVKEYGPFIVNTSRLTLEEAISSLTVTSEFSARVDRTLPSFDSQPRMSEVRIQALADRDLTARGPSCYIYDSLVAIAVAEIAEWAAPWLAADRGIAEAASALMHAIHDQFTYDSKATEADTPPVEAFRARRGVCQDFAHIMIIALRAYGIPAAYVSGYLRTLPPPGKPRLVGADATHAWVNVWCGAAMGWTGFDPTNAILAVNDHIFTAMGRDYADVSPLDGVFIGRTGQRMKVSVDVLPLNAP